MNRTRAILLLGVLLMLAGPARGQQAPPQAPPPQPMQPLAFPAFEQRTLPNGLEVIVIEHHEQPAVSLRLVSRAGAIFDPAQKAGLAAATADLLTQGTASRSAQELAAEIDFVGGSLGASAGRDAAYVTASVTANEFDLGLELLADVVLRPTFPEEELDRWRTQSLSGLQVQMQDPDYLASAAFDRAVFGAHAYGQPMSGTPASVRALTRDDLVAFHRRHFLPNTSLLAVVGDVDPEAAFEKAAEHLGAWKRGEAAALPAFDVPERTAPHVVVVDKPDAVQTQIRVGHVALERTDPDFFTAQIYNSVFGGGSGGYLYEVIRGERGLTYGAYSSFSERLQPGPFQVTTFTKSESTAETVEAIFDQMERMQTEAVPGDRLETRTAYLTGAFPLQIETPAGIASQVLDARLHGYGKDYLEAYRDRLDAVTPADVQAFARERTHPSRAVVVLAGNASAFEEALRARFGSVETIPIAELDLLRADLRQPKAGAPAPVDEAAETAAAEVIRAAVDALGGDAFLAMRAQVTRGSGTLSPPGMGQEMEVESMVFYEMPPNKSRVEISMPFGRIVQGFNGERGWFSMAGQVQDQTAQMRSQSKHGVGVLRELGDAHTLRPLPDETMGERAVKVVDVSDPDGNTTRFFIDAETGLIRKTSYQVSGQEFAELYDDYRVVEGVQIPHEVRILQNGSTMLAFDVAEVEINPELDPALFDKP